jgi:hypothetical protein
VKIYLLINHFSLHLFPSISFIFPKKYNAKNRMKMRKREKKVKVTRTRRVKKTRRRDFHSEISSFFSAILLMKMRQGKVVVIILLDILMMTLGNNKVFNQLSLFKKNKYQKNFFLFFLT